MNEADLLALIEIVVALLDGGFSAFRKRKDGEEAAGAGQGDPDADLNAIDLPNDGENGRDSPSMRKI